MPRKPRTLTVDLHGHDVLTAIDLAMRRVAEAHQNGYASIELVHGAADVEEPAEEGRGRIKWELRRRARGGLFERWADSSRTWEKGGSLVLYLKPNPRAQRESWLPDPGRRYR